MKLTSKILGLGLLCAFTSAPALFGMDPFELSGVFIPEENYSDNDRNDNNQNSLSSKLNENGKKIESESNEESEKNNNEKNSPIIGYNLGQERIIPNFNNFEFNEIIEETKKTRFNAALVLFNDSQTYLQSINCSYSLPYLCHTLPSEIFQLMTCRCKQNKMLVLNELVTYLLHHNENLLEFYTELKNEKISFDEFPLFVNKDNTVLDYCAKLFAVAKYKKCKKNNYQNSFDDFLFTLKEFEPIVLLHKKQCESKEFCKTNYNPT